MAQAYLTIDPVGEATVSRHYRIRQKMFSVKESYKIKDESDQPIFNVRSKLWTLGDNLLIEDMAGNGLGKILQEVWHMHPTWKIFSMTNGEPNQELAVIKQKFSFREKFAIDSVYGEYNLESSNWKGKLLTVTKQGRTVAVIKRNYFTTSDDYALEVDGDEDQAFIISLIIVINQALYTYSYYY